MTKAKQTTHQATQELIRVSKFTHDEMLVQKLIWDGADVNGRNQDGMTAIMQAAKFNNNPDIIAVLVNNKADVNAVNNKIDRYTPVMMAAGYNENPAVTAELVKAGADLDAKDWQHSNALEWSHTNDNQDVWDYLYYG